MGTYVCWGHTYQLGGTAAFIRSCQKPTPSATWIRDSI